MNECYYFIRLCSFTLTMYKNPSQPSDGHIRGLSLKVSHPVALIGLMRVDQSDQQTCEILLCWKHLSPPASQQSHCSPRVQREQSQSVMILFMFLIILLENNHLFLYFHNCISFFVVTTAKVKLTICSILSF